MSTATIQCEKCGDTGQIGHPEANGGYWTQLCSCRESLPARYGKADWWTDETVLTETFDMPCLLQSVVRVMREVPIDGENFRVHRTLDNIHYPTLAGIEIDCNNAPSHVVREYAEWLNKLADQMDKLDEPHPDEGV